LYFYTPTLLYTGLRVYKRNSTDRNYNCQFSFHCTARKLMTMNNNNNNSSVTSANVVLPEGFCQKLLCWLLCWGLSRDWFSQNQHAPKHPHWN